MADQRWRTELGIVAIAAWSVLFGFPVLLFHLRSSAMVLGEHIHAAILFIGSQGLIFWIAARPRPPKQPRTPPELSFPVSPFQKSRIEVVDGSASARAPESIWNAQVVPTETESWNSEPNEDAARATGLGIKISIGNYVGSSKPRRVFIEPGGAHHTLMPGQSIQVTATGRLITPSVRIVESDLATQVFIEGLTTDISARMDKKVANAETEQNTAPQTS